MNVTETINRFKNIIVIIGISIAFIALFTEHPMAGSIEIKGVTKIYRMGGYTILINYETRDKWTDNLIFKAHCKFDKDEFIFTSSRLDNIQEGWHKVEIAISEVIKKRYGSLRGYKVELYYNGILIDSRDNY